MGTISIDEEIVTNKITNEELSISRRIWGSIITGEMEIKRGGKKKDSKVSQ